MKPYNIKKDLTQKTPYCRGSWNDTPIMNPIPNSKSDPLGVHDVCVNIDDNSRTIYTATIGHDTYTYEDKK